MTVHHTLVADAAVLTWNPLDDAWEVCAPALVDTAHTLASGRPYLARLNYDEAEQVAAREGGRLISSEQLEILRRVGVQLAPFLGTPTAENDIEHSRRHDENVWAQLDALGWTVADGKAVMGAGKHWVIGAPVGKSRLKGWDRDGAGPGVAYWQPDSVAHNRLHFDDGTTTLIVRKRRDTDPAPKSGTGWIESVAAAVTDALAPPTDAVRLAFDVVASGHLTAKAPREIPDRLTPGTSQSVYDALARAWREQIGTEPRRTSLLLLCAQWALETGWGKSSHCNNLGNVRAKPNGSRSWCYYAANEVLLNEHARALVAKAKPRRDGKGPDAVITHTGEKTSTVWFYPDSDGACFRAFDTLDEGAADYLEILRKRFTLAWVEVERGDPAAFGHALKAQNFFTAPADDWVDSKGKTQRGYVSSLVSLVKSLSKTIA